MLILSIADDLLDCADAMDIHRIYGWFLPRFRAKRKILFHELMSPEPCDTILDVGGSRAFWLNMDCNSKIVILNIDASAFSEEDGDAFEYVKADALNLPFSDGQFDIVFSNSVIEHVGDIEKQRRFANEVRRVARRYWVQTPNRRFFVEPHLISPFIHFFPRRVQRRLIRWFTIHGLVTKPTQTEVDAFLDEVRLLTEEEMSELFPDATIYIERFLWLKKSLIAVKR